MKLGTVVFFNKSKGFGFIKPDAGGVNIFFHINSGRAVRRSESAGQPELVKHEELAPPKEGDIICMLDIIPASGNKKNPTADLWVYEMDWRMMGGTVPVPGQEDAPMTEEELIKGLEGLVPPIPSFEEIEDVVDGIFGLQQCIMGAVDQCGVTMEQIGVFVRNTPGGKKGEALWKEFTQRRDQKDRGEYTFATFIREVIAESKRPSKPAEPIEATGGEIDPEELFGRLRKALV